MTSLLRSLNYAPVELHFGTSGLRGLVVDMTDLECYINTLGFLRFLATVGEIEAGQIVYVAGDLRDSTPRITKAVVKAIVDGGYMPVYCGLIPTPAVALFGYSHLHPSIMVTGSHIPADRNGIKFNKRHDEVLKVDEGSIKEAVAAVRAELYAQDEHASQFHDDGSLKESPALPKVTDEAREHYKARFLNIFGPETLAGKHVVMYQHSAVGRDVIVELLESLGAKVTAVGRSDVFIPIDSENVTEANRAYFHKLVREHEEVFAVVSTDGDSDRPFVVDETGEFHRGDVLGALVATWLGADAAAFPVSTSDAVTTQLTKEGVGWVETKIGSPFVISAMKDEVSQGKKRVVGWEVNGGFLTGSAFMVKGKELRPLPTRDAFTAILVALVAACEARDAVSEVFGRMPKRFTQAGLLNDFPVEVSKRLVQRFSANGADVRRELETYFDEAHGFGKVTDVNTLDGVKISFSNGDVAHMRPSGNAPQLRIYSVADSQERADEIVDMALDEPDGIYRRMEKTLGKAL